jgi:hypothetical protein
MQRIVKAYSYFTGGRSGSKDGSEVADGVAFDPTPSKGEGWRISFS